MKYEEGDAQSVAQENQEIDRIVDQELLGKKSGVPEAVSGHLKSYLVTYREDESPEARNQEYRRGRLIDLLGSEEQADRLIKEGIEKVKAIPNFRNNRS